MYDSRKEVNPTKTQDARRCWRVSMNKKQFLVKVYLLVCGGRREGEHHLFFLIFRSILHVAFIHRATDPHTAWRGRGRWWQWWEDWGPIRASWCGWNPTSWTLQCGRVAHASHGPWACSLVNWMSTSCSATPCCGEQWSGHIPRRYEIDRTHVGKWVRWGVWMLAEGWCWSLSQISDSHSVGIVGERGRLWASSACHPCPCRDRASILTADLRSHHIRKTRRGEKSRREPALPLCSYNTPSVFVLRGNNKSFSKPRFASQLALADKLT